MSSTSYTSSTSSASFAIQSACDAAQSAVSSYSQLLFAVSGRYTNTSVLSSASTSVYQNLVQVGEDALQVNYMQNFTTFSEYGSMCSRLSNLFVSVYTYSEAITSRDTDRIVQNGLRDFMDGAWSMLSSLNGSVTDCDLRASLGTGADGLQDAFLSLAQYETISEFYPEITFACKQTTATTTTDSGTGTSSSKTTLSGPTGSTSWTGSVFITTFQASTSDSINMGPVLAAGFLGSLFCLLV